VTVISTTQDLSFLKQISIYTQNFSVFELFPSPGIVENIKHDVSETGSVCPQVKGKDTYSVWSIKES
jgi:hypothetical protein